LTSRGAEAHRRALEGVVAKLAPRFRRRGQRDLRRLLEHGGTTLASTMALARDGPESAAVREIACWFLGRLRRRRAAGALVEALADGPEPVRAAAAVALGELADASGAPALSRALRSDASPIVRQRAAGSLGQLAAPKCRPALVRALTEDVSAEVRGQAAEALGSYGARAVAPLVRALEDPAAEVRFFAAFGLAQLSGERAVAQALPALRRLAASDRTRAGRWGSVRKEALSAIAAIEARPR
jgi:HEAT repeat protein